MYLTDLLTDPNAWAALVTLTALEIVLGIDNVIFISLLVSRLDYRRARRTRQIGLALAFVFRVLLLGSLAFLVGLRDPVITILDYDYSWRDIILIAGGLFLITKATSEIHGEIEARDSGPGARTAAPQAAFMWVVLQLIVIDLVFSLDSIITAIAMAQDIEVMVAAIVIAMVIMYAASGPVSKFIVDYPTTKMLALAFLVLIGVALMADGFSFHIPRGYIYFAMAFAAVVEFFNVLARRQRKRRPREEQVRYPPRHRY